MKLQFSIIVPVYNRPQEIEELLYSIQSQTFKEDVEIILVEDGSSNTCEEVIKGFSKLNIQYFFKENSGPGASRNYGMSKATGNYFIILDSDVILPENYLSIVSERLKENYTDAFGGPDAAHPDFTTLQKAINYSMTSFLTTGGIRGKEKGIGKFQPRSFNMGISKKAFEVTKGFSDMRAGEDIDFTFRLLEKGFDSQLIHQAFVYHKRRNTLLSFYKQTFAFGSARPILNKKYPSSAKLTYWFPSLFAIGFDLLIILAIVGYWEFSFLYQLYFIAIFFDSLIQNKNFLVAFLSLITTTVQMFGYGIGFLNSQLFEKNN